MLSLFLVAQRLAYSVYVCAHLPSRVQLFLAPMNCSLPGSSVHGIFQARILELGTRKCLLNEG